MFRKITFSACVALGFYILAISAQVGWSKPETLEFNSGYKSIVDNKGNISFPQADFRRDWTLMGVWVVNDETQPNGLHNVYAQPGVINHYRKTGAFPDGAVLVKELLGAVSGDYTTGRISFAHEIKGWFVMIKDQKKRFIDHPNWGNGWGWAFFKASNKNINVTKNYKDECLTCHIPAKKTDWVYTEAYPVLGIKAVDNERFKSMLNEFKKETMAVDMSHNADRIKAEVELIKRGEKIFRRCKACHSLEVGKNKSGPYLAGVYGRKAGTAKDFRYSGAMMNSKVIWDAESLDKHLADVPNFIPGNRMAKVFRNGVKKADDRKAVIEFLKTK